MVINKLLFTIFLVFGYMLNTYAQITITSEPEATDSSEIQEKELVDDNWDVEVFGYANWSRTNRVLEINDGLFGDSLGERANETSLDTWSYGVGFKSRINESLFWQGGISYVRNGESYKFSDTDTSFSYKTTYSYLSMPLKVSYQYGKNAGLIGAIGIMPQMFVGYQQDQHWVDSLNATGSNTVTSRPNMNSFVFSAVANLGAFIRFNNQWILAFVPEYRIQLSSSYTTYDPHKHFGRAFGFNIRLGMQL
jgi:hypothetical protein